MLRVAAYREVPPTIENVPYLYEPGPLQGHEQTKPRVDQVSSGEPHPEQGKEGTGDDHQGEDGVELCAQRAHLTRVEVEQRPLHQERQRQEQLADVVWAPDAQGGEVDQSGEGKAAVHGDVLQLGEVIEGAIRVGGCVQSGVSARGGRVLYYVHTLHHYPHHTAEYLDDGLQGHTSAEGLGEPGPLMQLVVSSLLFIEGNGRGVSYPYIPVMVPVR